MQIHSYLTFNGNCREAMRFYHQCLGGELFIRSIGDTPLADKLPELMKKAVLHSTLTNGDFMMMGTDILDEEGLTKGNSISLMVNFDDEEQLLHVYHLLSDGGKKLQYPQRSEEGELFGDLTDRFGHHWILHCGGNN